MQYSKTRPDGWCRSSEYVIDHEVLVPAAGADFQVWNPWDRYDSISPKRRTIEPPYVPLLQLAQRLTYRPRPNGLGSYAPTDDSLEGILKWCREYGLLGILPAFSRRITLAPQWFVTTDVSMDGPVRWVPGYRSYVREAGRWEEKLHAKETEAARGFPESGKGAGQPVSPQVCPAEWPRPSVELWSWRDFDWRQEPLSGRFATFFPTVPSQHSETFPYPLPGTKQFWDLYAEPVETFVFWVERFREAVEVLSGPDRLEEQREGESDAVSMASHFLQPLANAVGTPRVIGRDVSRVLVSPSLLCSFAEMFLRDLEAGRRTHRCETCNKIFVSRAVRAEYCQPRCRLTMQRRRQRRRQSEMVAAAVSRE